MVALELPEVVVDGLDVVPQVVQALQHQAAFITGLRLLLRRQLQCNITVSFMQIYTRLPVKVKVFTAVMVNHP